MSYMMMTLVVKYDTAILLGVSRTGTARGADRGHGERVEGRAEGAWRHLCAARQRTGSERGKRQAGVRRAHVHARASRPDLRTDRHRDHRSGPDGATGSRQSG